MIKYILPYRLDSKNEFILYHNIEKRNFDLLKSFLENKSIPTSTEGKIYRYEDKILCIDKCYYEKAMSYNIKDNSNIMSIVFHREYFDIYKFNNDRFYSYEKYIKIEYYTYNNILFELETIADDRLYSVNPSYTWRVDAGSLSLDSGSLSLDDSDCETDINIDYISNIIDNISNISISIANIE